MEDCHNVYIKLNVVLLADCMENFCRVGIQEYGIDPEHCWTLAGYTWRDLDITHGLFRRQLKGHLFREA